jgi:hypothetical protein
VVESWASDLWQPDRGMAAKWRSCGRQIFGSLTVGWLPSGESGGRQIFDCLTVGWLPSGELVGVGSTPCTGTRVDNWTVGLAFRTMKMVRNLVLRGRDPTTA